MPFKTIRQENFEPRQAENAHLAHRPAFLHVFSPTTPETASGPTQPSEDVDPRVRDDDPLASEARAQYFGQYGSPQAPSPQQPYNPSSGGCYTDGVRGSCYSVAPATRHDSCYTSCYTQGPHTPFEQHLPQPVFETLCHDKVYVTHKITLDRKYPVYVHLREQSYQGVEIEERWTPYCVICTKDKPCPRHVKGQTPADLPGPADPLGTAPSPAAPTSSNAPNPGEAPTQVTASPGEPSPTTTTPAEAPAPTVAAAPSTAPTPAESPASPAATGPAKQWVWLAYEGVWGYGHQRADGYWEIESRRAPDGAAPQLAAQPGM